MTMIKICGLTRREDVDAAVAAGADFLGFNLWIKSRRYVDPKRVPTLISGLPSAVLSVGVFVHGEPNELARADLARVDWVQVHGAPEEASLATAGRPTIRAWSVTAAVPATAFAGEAFRLLDSPQTGHGGGGQPFDWSLAKAVAGHPRLFLAGGLTPENVGEAIRALRPFAVDVASGCESAPGIKDRGRLRAFVQAVREADRTLEDSG